MVYIYILKLEQGKYYIGKTINARFRLEKHFNLNGSQWTKLYKPIKVIEIKPNCDDYDEDKITMQYMDKYGIDNVRGGSFVSTKLEPSTIEILKQMSKGTNNKCFLCGKNGHFAKDCLDTEFVEIDSYEENYIQCFRCGREGHYASSCYASKHINYIQCFRCGREGHYASSCYASKHIKGYYLK